MRAIDKTLEGLFRDSKGLLFPGNPLEHLEDYKTFTEWSLLVDVARWADSTDPAKRALGVRWRKFMAREVRWQMACERTLFFGPEDSERTSIFQKSEFVEQQ